MIMTLAEATRNRLAIVDGARMRKAVLKNVVPAAVVVSLALLLPHAGYVGDPLYLVPAYGHGLGLDRVSPVQVHDKKISIIVEMPQRFEDDGGGSERITVTAIDGIAGGENAKNITLLLGMYHEGQLVFQDNFFAADGVLILDVESAQSSTVEITGVRGAPLESWHPAEDGRPVRIAGPVFGSGGLYTFEISVLTIDDPTNIVDSPGTYYADLSVEESASYLQTDLGGAQVMFGTKSYFDKITYLNYDARAGEVTFGMPFDWSEKRMSHIPVLHEEIHFPKDFEEFYALGYEGYANGIKLFKASVITDDYTMEDDRIVHFVLLHDHIRFLKNEMKKSGESFPDHIEFKLVATDKIDFPLTAYTLSEDYHVNLSWDPLEIQPGVETMFIFTIRDATGTPLRDSAYTFVILQNDDEIYRAYGNARIGGHFETYTFGEDQTGPTTIRFENIRNTGQETEFGIFVVPEFGTAVLLALAVSTAAALFFTSKHNMRLGILQQYYNRH